MDALSSRGLPDGGDSRIRSEENGFWRGIFPSIPTAFSADGSVDLLGQQQVAAYARANRAHGLLCFGLAGEVGRLTPDERERLVTVILEEAGDTCPVLVGVTAESEFASRRLAAHAEQAGASGIVIAPPPGVRAPSVLEEFFERIASCVTIPIMLQDAPEYLGVELGEELVEHLLDRYEHVKYLKIEGGPGDIERWIAAFGTRVGVFGGNGGLYTLDCLRVGAVGIAPGLELVDSLNAIYASEAAGDREKATRLLAGVLPLLTFEMQSLDHFNACAKFVLREMGVALEPVLRAPAASLSEHDKELLQGYMRELEQVKSEVIADCEKAEVQPA